MLLRFNTEIQNLTEINLADYTEAMEKTAAHAFLSVQKRWGEVDAEINVTITVVNDSRIQSLNKRFRRIDRPTDVLSFPLLEKDFFLCERLNEKYVELGDIVLSIDRAMVQAQEFEHSLKRELCFLTAHSMLHLLGFDHKQQEEEQEMTKKQEEILTELGICRFREQLRILPS